MKGEVRNPNTVWLLCLPCVTFGIYPIYFLYTVFTELKNYLGREDINPIVELLIAFACGPFMIYRLGQYIQQAQQKAGIQGAENQWLMFILWNFICMMGTRKMQEELNRIWEGGGGQPATF